MPWATIRRRHLELIDTTREEDIPVDGFQRSSGYTSQETAEGLKRCVFTWNKARFKDPERFFAEMKKRGITVSPNVKPGILLSHPDLEKMKEKDMFVKDSVTDEAGVGTWWAEKECLWISQSRRPGRSGRRF